MRVVTFEDELAENTESVIVRIVPDDEGFTTVDPEQGEAILLIRDNDGNKDAHVLQQNPSISPLK